MSKSARPLGLLALTLLLTGPVLAQPTTSWTTDPIASGLREPIFVTFAPGDSNRLFVLEKPGVIRIIENGTLLGTPFLNIEAKVDDGFSEKGLLGLAFPPDYQSTGRFYVNYINNSENTQISRFEVSTNPNVADTAEEQLLEIPQFADNHNGGMMAFSPLDGYLYIGVGDGGGSGDPGNRAQNLDSLVGKMLRLDVAVASGYTIPATNPFVGTAGRDEIWSYGWRNPWRWSFDRLLGHQIIGDVGQAIREEVSFEAAGSPGGSNYGWRLKEGFSCFNPSNNCDPNNLTVDPITQYFHNFGKCSITGGYVYRGCAVPGWNGYYLYGDYCTGEVFALRLDNTGAILDSVDISNDLNLPGFQLASFGEDLEGELYIVLLGSGISNGQVLKLVPDGVPPVACGPCCVNDRGNIDGSPDDAVGLPDISVLIDHLFISFLPLVCPDEADLNEDGDIGLPDLSRLIDNLFITFTPLPTCP